MIILYVQTFNVFIHGLVNYTELIVSCVEQILTTLELYFGTLPGALQCYLHSAVQPHTTHSTVESLLTNSPN